MRIVCDTNVLVSGVLFRGHPRRILTLVSRGHLVNFTSQVLLREAEDVLLRSKFSLQRNQVSGILALFRDTFELVHPSRRVNAIANDPSDNMVLEAADAASAERIVSGDKHLLDLKEWNGVRIVPPAAFMRELAGRQIRR
jgi:uncharacterized protein